MRKFSFRPDQFLTFYTAPDWLAQTERGQRYLYQMSVDIYQRLKRNNDQRLRQMDETLVVLEDRLQDKIEKAQQLDVEENIQQARQQYLASRKELMNTMQIHFIIANELVALKSKIETLDYPGMIIQVDKIVSISHHRGSILSYADEWDEDVDQKTDDTFHLAEGGSNYLEQMVYPKYGEYFQNIGEHSGMVPDDALGYNLRQRNWEELESKTAEENVLTVADRASKTLTKETPGSDAWHKTHTTLNWAVAWMAHNMQAEDRMRWLIEDPEANYFVLATFGSERDKRNQIGEYFLDRMMGGDGQAYEALHKFVQSYNTAEIFIHTEYFRQELKKAIKEEDFDKILLLLKVLGSNKAALNAGFESHLAGLIQKHPDWAPYIYPMVPWFKEYIEQLLGDPERLDKLLRIDF